MPRARQASAVTLSEAAGVLQGTARAGGWRAGGWRAGWLRSPGPGLQPDG